MEERNRINWVDVLKFLGMLAIYIGHFGLAAGKTYAFVFQYHVPLFFFVSGFFDRQHNVPLAMFIKTKTIRLMLPYCVFSALALVYFSLVNNWDAAHILSAAKSFAFGIRNRVFAGSLWFIPCLFFVSIIHYTFIRIFKRTWVSVLFSVFFFIGCQWILPNNPVLKPSWILNLDSAMYYYLYFAIGSAVFPLLSKDSISSAHRKYSTIASGITLVIAAVLFINGPNYFLEKLCSSSTLLASIRNPLNLYFYLPISALVLIHANVCISKSLSDILLFRRLGQETLIFCGTENVFKDLLAQIFVLFGWARNLSNPLITSLYAFMCLLVSLYFVVPIVKWLLSKVKHTVVLERHHILTNIS